jgi:small subunit ribosomal protein S1
MAKMENITQYSDRVTTAFDGGGGRAVVQQMEKGVVQNGLDGVIVGASSDFVWIDIGTDHLAVAALAEFTSINRNEKLRVYLAGSDPEDLHLVSRTPWKPPKDRQDLKLAFERRAVVPGVVTSLIKGGFLVEVGAKAFMPTSRSGGRDRDERESLIGKQILCTIEEFDDHGDIIVDRRRLLEAAELWGQHSVLEELKVGMKVKGTVCTLTDFGAFVDLGGIDGLVHVRDISWQYVEKPADVLSIGQQVDAVIEKIDARQGRVALSIKAMQPDPWVNVGTKYRSGDRVRGTVTSVTSFGAFVELEAGVEGLVHQVDLSWSRLSPPEIVSPGTAGEFLVLDVQPAERRIALGRKQLISDPWQNIEERYPVGRTVTGKVTTLTSFGAFVAVDGEIEGMIHITDMAEGRTRHPRNLLKEGQQVVAQVLESDSGRKRLRLGIRQLNQHSPEASLDVTTERVSSRTNADFTYYSRSVFVNCPTDGRRRTVVEAIVFAVMDSGLFPRLADHKQLINAVRECQYAIHDVSRPFQMGVFVGCKEYGADLHRMKDQLLITSGEAHDILGRPVVSHASDPATAVRQVATWLAQVCRTGNDENRACARYKKFVDARSGSSVAEDAADVELAGYIRAVDGWLKANS